MNVVELHPNQAPLAASDSSEDSLKKPIMAGLFVCVCV